MSCVIRRITDTTYRVLATPDRAFLGSISLVSSQWRFLPSNSNVAIEHDELNDILLFMNQIKTGTLVSEQPG